MNDSPKPPTLARSYLFVPGDRPERFAKALAAGAHAVIIDLEDAVTPAQKEQAREQLRAWLQQAGTPVFVRVNPSGTPWHAQDCELLALPTVRGVMVPKAQDAADLARIAAMLRPGQALVPLVETVEGWFEAAALAAVPKVERLAFGSFDFLSDAGIQADGPELDPVRTQLVLVSRRAGIAPPIDGVSLAIDDAARVGLGAKLCIHPRQVAAVHAAFAPRPEEVEWARRVLAALAAGSLGAVAVDGKLVDRPVALLAETILAEAAAR